MEEQGMTERLQYKTSAATSLLLWQRDISCGLPIRPHAKRCAQIRITKIWMGVQAWQARFCRQKSKSSTVEGQNSETSPLAPHFQCWQWESKCGLENHSRPQLWKLGFGGKQWRALSTSEESMAENDCRGLIILSFYVIPFPYRGALTVVITFPK